jgi:hypothetical protein
MLFYKLTFMASRFVNTYRGKTGMLSKNWPHASNTRRNFAISTTRLNCQRLTLEGVPQNELTQLQHSWYLSDFYIYAPNEYTILCKSALCSKYGIMSHVTWNIPFLHGKALLLSNRRE